MTDSPLTIFQVAGRAMSAQLVRMNTTASNLANAGGIASSADAAYKTIKPVFRTQYDNATGLATVNVERIVTAGEEPTKRYDPTNPMADENGNIWESAVDETRQLVDMMEPAHSSQTNVEVMQPAKAPILPPPQPGR